MSILKSETYKKSIIYSSAFNVAGKSVAFIQQLLIGYYFGVHANTDIFFFTYNIILFASFFFLNFTTSVLIPEGMKIREKESDKESKRFLNSYILYYGITGVLLSAFALLGTGRIFSFISSFPEETIRENLSLIKWCVPLIFLNITVSIMTEILASYKYFTAPNLVTLINYLLGVTFIVLFHDTLGIDTIAIGLLAGYLFNLFIVTLFMRKALDWKFLIKPAGRFKHIFSNGLYSQAGHIVYLAALYVPQNLFSQLPAGSLTAVNFADKLLAIPSIFLVAQITNVMGIKINSLVSKNSMAELSKLTEKLAIWVTFGLLAAALLISLLSTPFINLIFSWGNFDDNARTITAGVLSTMIFYLPFSFLFEIYKRLFNAFKKQNHLFYLQLLTQGVSVALYLSVIPQFGLYSYPVCKIIPYILTTAFAAFLLKKTFRSINTKRLTLFHACITATTVIFTALALYWH